MNELRLTSEEAFAVYDKERGGDGSDQCRICQTISDQWFVS
jgi:hypothetical protein